MKIISNLLNKWAIRKLSSRMDKVLELNPDGFTVRDLKEIIGGPLWLCRILCDNAVEGGDLAKLEEGIYAFKD